jgi:RNA polymerase sigma-70 factor, ECF subfamily
MATTDQTMVGDGVQTIGDGARDIPASERVDVFVQLLGQNQRRIFLFVVSMVPNWSEAEEIIQETNLILWREFDRFQPGTNFGAWSCQVALNQVLAWRKRQHRDRTKLSQAFLEAVAEEATADADWLEDRSRALAVCIEKLPERHRLLLRSRYNEGRTIDAIGRELGRSADAIYRTLSRIRHSLYNCVTESLTQGHPA